ncbi:MAG: alpha/beta hydrolase [Myxococcota bacterium]
MAAARALGSFVAIAVAVACANPVQTRLRTEAAPTTERIAAELADARRETAEDPASARARASRRRALASLLAVPEAELTGIAFAPRDAELRVVPTQRVRVEGLRHYQTPGDGLPVSLEGRAPPSPIPWAKFPPEGRFTPATALLSFPSTDCARVSWVDPRRFDAARLEGRRLSLAADLTVPYSRLLDSARLTREGRTGLLRAFSKEREGLFLLEPYDPARTPLLMVHGLGSSPSVWSALTNAVYGEPELRRHYQVWHYFYATGVPYLWTSREMRRTLRRTLEALGHDAGIVAVGHSMGGLLLKASISKSGDRLWREVFRVPPAKLRVSDADRALLESLFWLNPMPSIERAIFVMSPHRGSDLAGGLAGALGNALIELPPEFTELFRRVAASDADALRPRFRSYFEAGGPTSIRALAPDHPLLAPLADLPVPANVRFHNVIGDVGDGSDDVVRVSSALLPGADSTSLVPAGHTELEAPVVTEELIELLRAALPTVAGAPRVFTPDPTCDPA